MLPFADSRTVSVFMRLAFFNSGYMLIASPEFHTFFYVKMDSGRFILDIIFRHVDSDSGRAWMNPSRISQIFYVKMDLGS